MNFQDDCMNNTFGAQNMNCPNMMNPAPFQDMGGCPNMMDMNMQNAFPNMNCPNMTMQTPFQNVSSSADDLERFYPDTYRIIYPMVVSTCNVITMPLTEEMLNRMTDDIYDRAQTDDRIRMNMMNMDAEMASADDDPPMQNPNNPMRRRRRRNPFFRDFIRVLLLRELLGRRQRFPFRPF